MHHGKPWRAFTGAAGCVLKLGGVGAAGLALSGTAPSPVDTGKVVDGKVQFPPWRGEQDPPSSPPPQPLPPSERVGFAIVGPGRLSLEQILPAFGESKRAKLSALVSGTPDKLRAVARQHGIPESRCYDYPGFDRLKDAPDVKAVYVVLPPPACTANTRSGPQEPASMCCARSRWRPARKTRKR